MEQTGAKGIQECTWLGGKGESQGLMQETKVWPIYEMSEAQTKIFPRKWDA